MARKKKKTTRKKKGGIFGLFSGKKKGRRSAKRSPISAGIKIALTILVLSVLTAGGAVGLMYLELFAKSASAQKSLPVTFYSQGEKAEWLQQEWYDILYGVIGGKEFAPSETLADELHNKLLQVPWLYNTRVKITPDAIEIIARYRRPVAWVKVSRDKTIYIDSQMHVMDYIPVSSTPVIEIKGLASKQVPPAGSQWLVDDAKAAVDLLNWLYQMDQNFQLQKEHQANGTGNTPQKRIPEKPLLNEIESIDVSNFAARKSRSKPNIVFNVKGGAKVYWGAAWGQADVYLEEDETKKLARFYQSFIDNDNTFTGPTKYIELRWLENGIPRPR